MTKRTLPILLISLLISFSVFSADIPVRPNPPKLVNDLADILDAQTESSLEWNLRALNDSTSNQIVVITVKTLNGYDPASYAYEIGEKWQVGQKDFNNGIVVLVKPKLSSSDRGRAFIAVGYGLEGIVPDAIAKRIVENEMIPFFKNNDYETGIIMGVNKLSQLVSGEISAEGYNKASKRTGIFSFLPFIIIFIVILLIRGSGNRSRTMGGRSNLPFWTALWLGSSIGNSSHSGSWGNFSGGSSGFGGGSSGGFGGGFGGFGGGSFGGGGAGGSW